jgi:hypothetical protein
VLAEYHMTADSPAYFLGGVGITRVGASFEGSEDTIFGPITIDVSDSSMEFTLTAGGGFQVNEQVGIEGRFNIISDTSYISVHGTYAF